MQAVAREMEKPKTKSFDIGPPKRQRQTTTAINAVFLWIELKMQTAAVPPLYAMQTIFGIKQSMCMKLWSIMESKCFSVIVYEIGLSIAMEKRPKASGFSFRVKIGSILCLENRFYAHSDKNTTFCSVFFWRTYTPTFYFS